MRLNKAMRPLGGFLVTAAALALLSAPALASCIFDERTLDQQIRDAQVVFVGTVNETSSRGRIASFRVEEIWKGAPLPTEVEVRGGPDDPNAVTSVDRHFEIGMRYLVFPTGDARSFEDNNCSPTRAYTDDLDAHRPPNAVSSQPGAQPAAVDPGPDEALDKSVQGGPIEATVESAQGTEEPTNSAVGAWLAVWVAGAAVVVGAGLLGAILHHRSRG